MAAPNMNGRLHLTGVHQLAGITLCPKYHPILMKIAKHTCFEVYYSYNLALQNFDNN